jgi:heme-degrading monooxygenase HmoA
MPGYRHIILFHLRPDVEPEQRDQALSMLRQAGTFPGIVEWTVEMSLDTRKGDVIVENSLFESPEAVVAFRTSEEHRAVGELMSQIADWAVGDYHEP